jgi:hypothetical protein
VVYLMDEEGFLIDEQGQFVKDDKGEVIKLSS